MWLTSLRDASNASWLFARLLYSPIRLLLSAYLESGVRVEGRLNRDEVGVVERVLLRVRRACGCC